MDRFKHVIGMPHFKFIPPAVLLFSLPMLQQAGLLTGSFVFAIGTTLIYSIMAIGFAFLLGYAGLASLGTAGFVGVGAYIAYFAVEVYGLPFSAALLITLLVSGLLGVIVGFISLRIEGIYLALLTLGLSEILRNTFLSLKATIKINLNSLKLFGNTVGEQEIYFVIAAILIVLLMITTNLINSPIGRALVSVKNSPSAAQAMGISLVKYRVLAFAVCTMYAAIAGLLYMMYVRNITASSSPLFTVLTSLNILGAVVIGGAKSLWGTMFGVFLIYGVQSGFFSKIPFFVQNPAFITMITGALIVVIVMYYPGGLAQMALRIKRKIKSKSAEKAV
ncbi:MAG: branched-chain amino acid ABC transporter permease [Bacillota bacterium]|nr:branched-chain amino acid ABC transporter permease [Bacillota bacterium]